MHTLDNNQQLKCCACLKIINKTQRAIKCLTCDKWFHAVYACIKSFDTNNGNTIDVCQICLKSALPFQTLDNLDNEFNFLNGNNISKENMDRLKHLKFNPFDTNNNIALSENHANLDNPSKINCEYYLPNDFNKLINTTNLNNTNSLSLIHLNTRSIVNKFDSFKQLMNSFNLSFQVIGLTETWLNDTNDDLFKLENYNFVNVNRCNKNGGGVGIYISNQMKYKLRTDLNLNYENSIESVFIETITAAGKNIIIGVIYRPPNNKLDEFENNINQILSKIDKENKICYLMGDFNIDLLKSESCDYSNRFLEILLSSSYIPLVLRPTRITQHTATLIDNIFTNDIETIDSSTNGIIFSDVSDHLPIVHLRSLKSHKKAKIVKEFISKRLINDDNMKTFIDRIKNTSWEDVLSTNDTTESYNRFFDLFSTVYESSFPMTKKNINKCIDKAKSPWMTNCIAKSVKKKNMLYKKYLNHPTIKNENNYKKYKNKLNHVIRMSKKKYYEEQLVKYKYDTKSLWKTLNQIMNKHETNKSIPKEFNGNSSEEKISDPHKIANMFNEYFVNVGPNIAKKIPSSDKMYNHYLTGSYKNNFFLEAVTKYELETEIKNLNPKKSPGYDGLSVRVVRNVANEISEPLSHIFNLTFTSGNIPDSLKKGLITPVFKANENNEFKNYRPISVLTCFSKLLEKLMYKRLIKFIDKNRILTPHQYGFRENRSTELAIIELTNRLTNAIDTGEFTIGIFLDLSKAFDTINHKILIQKLEHYGIRGVTKLWFQDYLTNRKQIVKYSQVRSKEMLIENGVPQGSILGPILFLLYVNDIENCSQLLSFVLFADDTNIFYSNKCLKTVNEVIQAEINKVSEWLNVNKLSLNITKTKFIVFRSP